MNLISLKSQALRSIGLEDRIDAVLKARLQSVRDTLGLAPNLVDFSKTLSNFVVQLCAGESQRGRTRIDKAKR